MKGLVSTIDIRPHVYLDQSFGIILSKIMIAIKWIEFVMATTVG